MRASLCLANRQMQDALARGQDNPYWLRLDREKEEARQRKIAEARAEAQARAVLKERAEARYRARMRERNRLQLIRERKEAMKARLDKYANHHALIITVEKYDQFKQLPPTVTADGEGLAAVLSNWRCCGFPAKNVRHLRDPNMAETLMALDELAKQTDPEKSTVLVYFACHTRQSSRNLYITGKIENVAKIGGGKSSKEDEVRGCYLCMKDAAAMTKSEMAATCIESKLLTKKLKKIEEKSQAVICFFDVQHVDTNKDMRQPMADTPRGGGFPVVKGFFQSLAIDVPCMVLRACDDQQFAIHTEACTTAWGGSLFGKHLTSAFRGQAAVPLEAHVSDVNITDIYAFIKKEMFREAKNLMVDKPRFHMKPAFFMSPKDHQPKGLSKAEANAMTVKQLLSGAEGDYLSRTMVMLNPKTRDDLDDESVESIVETEDSGSEDSFDLGAVD